MKASEAKELARKINKRTVETEQGLRDKIIEAVSKGKMFCIPVNVWYSHDSDRIVENLKADGYKLSALQCGPYRQYKIWWSDDERYPGEPELFKEYDVYNFKWEY